MGRTLVLAVLAVCAAAFPAAASPRRLQQTQDVMVGSNVTLIGIAVVIAINQPGKKDDKILSLRVNNRNLLVRGVARDIIDDLQSGQLISVAGAVEDLSEEEDEVPAPNASGTGTGTGNGNGNGGGKGRKRKFVKAVRAHRIRQRSPKKQGPQQMAVDPAPEDDEPTVPYPPELQQRRRLQSITFDRVAAAAWTTLPSVKDELSVLFVPMAAVISGGNAAPAACPGTTLPIITTAQIRQMAFQAANPGNVTVGSTFSHCSFNRSVVREPSSQVVPRVNLPCSGVSNGVPWNLNATCNYEDWFGAADAAEAALVALGVNVTAYEYKVFLMPPGPCNFVGIAFVGCGGSHGCRVWIGGNYPATAQAMSHELGHNLFLGHAGSYNPTGELDEYADDTCMMGYCCTDRCPNAPHTWQLGWHQTMQLDATNLLPGRTLNISLGAQAYHARGVVRINPTWAPTIDPLFLSFRLKALGDAMMFEEMSNKLHIYQAPTTGQYHPADTTLRASIAVGQAYRHAMAGITIRRASSTRGGHAVFTICRRGGAETAATCMAGYDHNCDGRAGVNDPTCAIFLK